MKGFTIVEALVSTTILLILVLVGFSMLDIGKGAWFTGSQESDLSEDLNRAMLVMGKELKNTRPSQISLGAGSTSSSLTFRLPQDNNSDGTNLDASGSVEWSTPIVYALNGSRQITRTYAGQSRILANNVSSLLFSRSATELNLLNIDVTVSKSSQIGRTLQQSAQITIKMRN